MSEELAHELHISERVSIFDRGNAQIIAANQVAATYAQIAVRSALLLNSSALFAGAALMGAASESGSFQSIAIGFFVGSACFVFGIVSAALSSFFSHKNLLKWVEWLESDTAIKAINKTKHYFKEHFEEHKEQFLSDLNSNTAEKDKAWSEQERLAKLSIGSAVVSYTLFVVGCLIVGGTIATA